MGYAPDKRKETYRDLFLNINSKCEDLGVMFNPPKLRLDYEHRCRQRVVSSLSDIWMQLPFQPVLVEESAECWFVCAVHTEG